MRVRLLLAVLLAGTILFSSGCWDRVEIEKRSFMVGVGLDAVKTPEGKEPPEESSSLGPLRLTMQVILPALAARGSVQSGGGGSEGQSPFWNMESVSEKGSVVEAFRHAFTRVDRQPYLGHLRVIVIGQDLARKGIAGPLDFFIRDPEARRRIKVLVTRQEALDVLSVNPRQESVSGNYLSELSENGDSTSRIGPPVFLGDVSRFLHEGSPFVLPHVDPAKEEVVMSGAGVFSGSGRLLGWLETEETRGLRFVLDDIMSAALVVPSPRGGGVDTVEIFRSMTRVKPSVEGNTVRFVIDIQMEGTLRERSFQNKPLDDAYLEKLEESVARDTEKVVTETINKIQKKFRVDILGFSEHLRHHTPWIWRQVEDRWEELFPTVPVTVKAHFNIRRVGTEF